MSAARRAARQSARGRWLLVAFLVLLVFSLALRYASDLGEGLGRAWDWSRGRLTGGEAVAPEAVGEPEIAALPTIPLRLQILNATGVSRLALERGEALRHWGVDTLDKTNAPGWPFPETLLVVRSGREGCRAATLALAERMGGVPVIVQRREDLMLDATLVLGHDWQDYRWPEP